MKKRAFTLIELIAVLVILTILALIVTPLVMNIIRKARLAADKRSIDSYGRSIELAASDYLLDRGDFPTKVSDLTVEYQGDTVECSTAVLNDDLTVYWAECKVSLRDVPGYTYGKLKTSPNVTYEAYEIGDEVEYNDIDYYVIKNTDESESVVTLLKKVPLTVSEVNLYGSGHINMYKYSNPGEAYNNNGYGGIAYYTSEACGYDSNLVNCVSAYNQSEVKYAVDSWALSNTNADDLVVDSTGYSVRLLSHDELITNLGYEDRIGTISPSSNGTTPSWIYNSSYSYWTMSVYDDSVSDVWVVNDTGSIVRENVMNPYRTLRPVITIKKSAIINH